MRIKIIIAIATWIGIMLCGMAKADSIQGKDDVLTVTLNTARDSVWVVFSYPDNNAYDSTLCLPAEDSVTASKYFISLEPVELDSIGCHGVIVRTFTSNTQTADTLIDQWCNFGAIASEPGTGYKTYPCTLFVLNSADSTAISNVPVTIRPLGGGRELVVASADVNGRLIYSSEIASISAYLGLQGWNFNAEDTLAIAGAQTDSLFGTAFSPSAPADQTGIFCWLLTPAGDTIDPSYLKYRLVNESDTSVYELADWITVGTGANKIVLNKNWVVIEVDTSLISFSVYPNDNIYVNGVLDSSSTYQWEADFLGNRTRKYEEVIDTAGNINPFAR